MTKYKTKKEVEKGIEKLVVEYLYSDTEELNDEHKLILEYVYQLRQQDLEAIVEMIKKEAYWEKTKGLEVTECGYDLSSCGIESLINKLKKLNV